MYFRGLNFRGFFKVPAGDVSWLSNDAFESGDVSLSTIDPSDKESFFALSLDASAVTADPNEPERRLDSSMVGCWEN
jgi:hypothetical protein